MPAGTASASNNEVILSDVFNDQEALKVNSAGNPLHLGIEVATLNSSTTADDLPATLKLFCVAAGLLRQGPTMSAFAYMWAARIWIVGIFAVASVNMIISMIVGVSKIQQSLGVPEQIHGSCSRSAIPDPNSDKVPCLLTAAYLVVSFFSSFTGLFLYTFLIKKNVAMDLAKLFSGVHGQRINAEFNKWSWRINTLVAANVSIVVLCFIIFVMIVLPSKDKSPAVTLLVVVGCCIVGMATCLTLLPGYIFAALLYAETSHLVFLSSDFHDLIERRPFNFNRTGPQYLFLFNQYQSLQQRLGRPSNVAFGGWLGTLAACYTIVAYALWTEHRQKDLMFETLTYMVLITIQFLPPFLLVIFATVYANNATDPIALACYTTMANPSQERTGVSLENDALLSEHDNAELAEQSTGAMKLAQLVEKLPCNILLFGQKFTWNLVVASITAVILSQVLGVVGLGG